MPFTDSQKVVALKEAMRMSVDAETDWNVLKDEFAACSEHFRVNTFDFLDRIKSLSELRAVTADARTQSLDDLIDELEI